MKSIAIIPARGGSKGIPRKCLRPVAGKPMIHYAIKASLACASIDRVVVSTDDEEIAMLAERFGAQVIMRPAELADDVTALDPVIAHAVAAAEERFNERYDIVYTVQPTSPLVQPHDLELAGEHFAKDPGIQTVLSVVDDRHLCWTVHDGEAVPRYERRVNRQQLPPNFRETGAIIACRREQLQRGTRVALLEMPPHRSGIFRNAGELLVVDAYATGAGLIAAAKQRRMHVRELQHGVVGRYHLGYSCPSGCSREHLPDELLVWSAFWQRELEDVWPASVNVYGYRYLDDLRAGYTDSLREPRSMVVISQGAISKPLADLVWANRSCRISGFITSCTRASTTPGAIT